MKPISIRLGAAVAVTIACMAGSASFAADEMSAGMNIPDLKFIAFERMPGTSN